MSTEELEQELPQRPRSAFANAGHAVVGKDGRQLGGCTTEEYHEEFWTPERREAQRQRAKEMIREGKFGAANGFHRRKTKRFQEIAAEHAQSKAEEIIQKLDAMIFSQHKDKRLQLEAIREYMKMEDWAVKNSREDEREFRAMTNDQLDGRLLEMLGEALGLDLEGIIDADVVEEEPLELVAANGNGYDPMQTELGGDRLRTSSSDGCERCEMDRAEMATLLQQNGIGDDEMQVMLDLTRCVKHRVLSAVVAVEGEDGDDE